MKKTLVLLFFSIFQLYALDIPDQYDTNIDNIEYHSNSLNIINNKKNNKINIITNKNINIPIKKIKISNIPYRKIKNSDNMKIIGNIVKIKNGKNIRIINKDDLEKEFNIYNNYLDMFINALKNFKEHNKKTKYSGCMTILDYYKGNSMTCFKLMKMLSNKEKIELDRVINDILGSR